MISISAECSSKLVPRRDTKAGGYSLGCHSSRTDNETPDDGKHAALGAVSLVRDGNAKVTLIKRHRRPIMNA